jgi:alpha-N-arabinofuranosidase
MFSPIISLRGLACLAVLTCPVLGFAQSVTVNVNAAAAVRTVDERVFGANSVIWDGLASSDQTISMLQAAGLRTIRIPGGSLSDEYRWRLNKGIDKANGNQPNTWTWFTGLDGFTKLITNLNAHAFVTVNYGSGTPEEAAAWVAYTNAATTATTPIGTDATGYNWQDAGTWASLRNSTALAANDGMNFLRLGRSAPWGLKYWEIGNECYGANWETDINANPHDPTTYAQRAKLYIEKMKAVDPTIKVGVVITAREDDYANGYTRSVTNPRTNVSYRGWTAVMLTTLRELGVTPDMVIYHRYEQAPASDQPNNPENDATLLQKGKTWPDDAAAMRRMVTDYLGATEGAKVEIVVTENNSVYSNPGKQSTSLVNGLFLADSVANLMQTEIGAFMWWGVRNGPPSSNGVITGNMSSSLYGWRTYGDYGMISIQSTLPGASTSNYDPHPTYYAFKLLSKFARHGDTVVQATSNNSLLSVFATKTTAGGVNLLVINKSPSSVLNASIAVSGFTPGSVASVYTYGKPQDDASRPGGSGTTDLLNSLMNISGASFTAEFAAYSMSVVQLFPVGTTPPTPPVQAPPQPPPATPAPAPTPTPTPTPTTPPSSGGGGGGGGGAPSLWFVGALTALAFARWLQVRR